MSLLAAGKVSNRDRNQVPCVFRSKRFLFSEIKSLKNCCFSRSTMDEYTPQYQVEYIQEKVTGMLERLYNDIDIIRDYENTS